MSAQGRIVTEISGAERELRPVLENDETGEEREKENLWEILRKIMVVGLLVNILFFVACAYSVVGSFFPIEAAENGSNALTTAIIIGASPLCLAILSPLVGYFLPKLGTKITLISGQLLVGGGLFLMGFLADMPSAMWFVLYGILLRLTEGVGWAMTCTTSYAFLPALFPSRVATLTGILLCGSGLGFTLGPPIGSLLVTVAGYGAPFWAVGGILLCLVPLASLLVKETSSSSRVVPLRIVFKLLGHLRIFMIHISNVLSIASLTFMDTALSVYLYKEVGLSLWEIGVYFAMLSATYVLGTVPTGWLSDKFGKRKFIIIGVFVNGMSLILLGITPFIPLPRQWTTVIALSQTGCGAALALVPAYSDLLQQAQELYPREEKESVVSAVSGMTTFSQSFGKFLGAILGGFLTYTTDFLTAVLIFGEAITAHAFLILGVSLIDHICRTLKY